MPNDFAAPRSTINVSEFTGDLYGMLFDDGFSSTQAGEAIASGDINGDGYDDLIIGAKQYDSYRGKVVVIFGSDSTFAATTGISTLDGTNGFQMDGPKATSFFGDAVASGDINGDGFDDIIIGAHVKAEAYVVYGKSSGFSATFDVTTLDGSNGFKLYNTNYGNAGFAVSSGDINGDGYADVVVSTPYDSNGSVTTIFGKYDAFADSIDIRTLDGSVGFNVRGINSLQKIAKSVSTGDINGDGYDDLIIDRPDQNSGSVDSSFVYIVFGKANGFSGDIYLSTLTESEGFKISVFSQPSSSNDVHVSTGDVNGDGYDDIIFGIVHGNVTDLENNVYVVYGKSMMATNNIQVSDLNGSNGFVVDAEFVNDNFGAGLSSDDINGDGYDEVVIGANFVKNTDGDKYPGKVYVVNGGSSLSATIDASQLNGINGFSINGYETALYTNLGASLATGDFNGDGYPDIFMGAPAISGSKRAFVFTNTSQQTITGDEGFRMLGTHASGKVFGDLIDRYWTQGFTNSDAPNYGQNVWTWDVSSQNWQVLRNSETDSLEAATGFLMYMFADDDNNGDVEGFPKTYSAPAAFTSLNNYATRTNTGVIYPFNDLANDDFFLLSNPFVKNIDWDSPTGWTRTNMSNTFYVWSDAANAWLTWNGITGTKSDGLISAGQSVFVQASGGTGSMVLREAIQTTSSTPILKQAVEYKPVNFTVALESEDLISKAQLSFHENGAIGKDRFDGVVMNPLATEFVQLGLVDVNQQLPLSIHSLPMDGEVSYVIPLMINSSGAGSVGTLSVSGLDVDLEDWSMFLVDNISGEEIELENEVSIAIELDQIAQKQHHSDYLPGPVYTKQKSKTANSRYALIVRTGNKVSNEIVDNPTTIRLHQNYPNPFNPSTIISFDLHEASIVSLRVYDVLGREVEHLIQNEFKQAGTYEVKFNASDLASGVYIYQLNAGSVILTKKLSLTK
ncbi:MAG: FG-GAP repeat protein [Balneolaceae bacterium]|nr:FG-GAP repeat protein [Balneolaceae bacterium]